MTNRTEIIDTTNDGLVVVKPVIETIAEHADMLNRRYRYTSLLNSSDLPRRIMRERIAETSTIIARVIEDESTVFGDRIFDGVASLHAIYQTARQEYTGLYRFDLYDGCPHTRSEHIEHVLGHEATKPFVLHIN